MVAMSKGGPISFKFGTLIWRTEIFLQTKFEPHIACIPAFTGISVKDWGHRSKETQSNHGPILTNFNRVQPWTNTSLYTKFYQIISEISTCKLIRSLNIISTRFWPNFQPCVGVCSRFGTFTYSSIILQYPGREAVFTNKYLYANIFSIFVILNFRNLFAVYSQFFRIIIIKRL